MISQAALTALLQNAATLVAMVDVFDLVSRRQRIEGRRPRELAAGVLLGCLGISLIMAAYRLESGVVFDTRSVLLTVSGLFLGLVPTAVAMLMTAAYRLWMGGTAVWMGVGVIVSTGCLGILWRKARTGPLAEITARELYSLGVLAHLLMVAWAFVMPWPTALRVLNVVVAPVLLVYPLATVAMGLLLAGRLRRELATDAIARSEDRFRTLVDKAPVPLRLMAADGGFLYSNRRCDDLFGYSLAEVPDLKTWWQVALPDPARREAAVASWAAAVAQARTGDAAIVPAEYVITCKGGVVRTVEIAGVVFGNEVLVTFLDLTSRRQAEEALQHREAEYRRIVETASEGITRLDAEGHIAFANQQAGLLLGRPAAELLGRRLADFVPTEDRPEYDAHAQRCQNGEDLVHEQRFARPDGTTLWTLISARSLQDEQGRFAGSLGLLTDITTRKEAELARQELQQRLHAAFELSPVGMVVATAQGQVLQVNPAFCRMLGYTAGELVGRGYADITHPEDQAASHAAVSHTAQSGEPGFTLEKRYVKRGGEIVWGRVSGTLQRDALGRPWQFLVHVLDITEQRRTTEALHEREATLLESQRQAGLGSYVLDIATSRWSSSEVLDDIFGIPVDHPHDVVSWRALVHPDEQQQMADYLQREVVEAKQPFDKEYRIIRLKDRAERWVHGLGYLEFGPNGEALKLRGTIQDITDWRRAKDAVQRAEAQYRALFEEALEGIYQTTVAGTFRLANPAMARILGFASVEELMRERSDITSQGYAEPNKRAEFRRLVETAGVVMGYEYQARRKDGTFVWVSENARVMRNERGVVVGYEGTIEDITKRRQAEAEAQKLLAAVRESRQTLLSVLEDQRAAERLLREQAETMLERNTELERFHQAVVGRELRMVELKQEINELCHRLGQAPRYQPSPLDDASELPNPDAATKNEPPAA